MPLFYAGTDAAAGAVGMGSLFLPLLAMLAVMYFLMIRPENKRKKEAEAMRSSLKKGDQITTIGGIVGKIVHVTDDNIVIETSDDRVRIELTKWAVSTNNSAAPAEKGKKKDEPAQIGDGSENEAK